MASCFTPGLPGRFPEAVARMRVFNPDASEPEMCGNGIRMFARYLAASGIVTADEFVVETGAGPISPRLLADGAVRVDMGRARFRSENIALEAGSASGETCASPVGEAGPAAAGAATDTVATGGAAGGEAVRGDATGGAFAGDTARTTEGVDGADVLDAVLEAGCWEYRFTFVDVGNPHCVVFVDDPAVFDVAGVGRRIERHRLFPNRVNVEFVRIEPDGSVSMRVWERGVGETQACGTGATAVGAACVRLGLAQSPVLVHLLGGDLLIEVEKDSGPGLRVFMTGPAEEVFTCTLSAETLRRLGWAFPGP